MLILLVEDDQALAMGTEYALKAENYEVMVAKNLSAAKESFEKKIPDLVLLDVMLPDGNGFEFLQHIKKTNENVPVIFLTAVSDEVNVVQGLDLGADDYVTKPYRVKELLSRISAVLRRSAKESPVRKEVSIGTHRLCLDEPKLYENDKSIELTVAEFRILKQLASYPGQILERETLLDTLYESGEHLWDDNTLSVYVKRIRDKLGEDATYIETIRGIGYRLNK